MNRAWWQFISDGHSSVPEFMVDDVHFVQPVGFVWLQKPRYRIKAGRRVR